jgi:hypothetical protein
MDATFHDFMFIGEVMKGPKRVETNRLVLRKPSMADAEAISVTLLM